MTVDPTKRYAIDIRIFLFTITTAMVLAFGVGVTFGPGEMVEKEHKWQTVEARTVLKEPEKEGPHEGPHEKALYEPSGQHLLIDIKGIDSDFLDSEERLAHAMVESVKAGGLTMLSYHCHKLIPSGVSCVGVLLESHISFHTWPEDGVITLDLFTCGSNPLIPVIPKVEALFAIGENTVTQWSHELRGFRLNDVNHSNYLDHGSDLGYWVLSPLEMHTKKMIVSTRSKFQQIDIWDITDIDDTPSHQDGINHNLQPGDPRWLTPELTTPDRLLFLDGTLQSIVSTEREYHEALVHPAMFAHQKPKHVALIGGGEGATLREVLKHKTVETVTMIELDEELVAICREHLPLMNDCSDLVGSAMNCFDDDKVNVVFESGVEWFIDRFGPEATKPKPEHKFDVLVVDALDPEENVAVAEMLYTDANFVASLLTSLSDDGIIVMQVGTAPNIHDPRADLGVYELRERMFNTLESQDAVKAMFVYEEAHCGFLEPWAFLVICKSVDCRSRWFYETDVIDYEIYDRIVETKSDDRALVHFDGATQYSYRFPPKAWETVYCRREPMPFECSYIALAVNAELHEYVIDNEEAGSFKIEYAETTEEPFITAIRDIPKGSYIMPSHLASSLFLEEETMVNLRKNVKVGDVKVIEDLLEFIADYGHQTSQEGLARTYVEVGASFIIQVDDKKANVGRWMPRGERPIYSPVHDRHHMSFDLFLVATKDIHKGEQIFKASDMWEQK